MDSSLTVRPARVADVAQMARVNVRCWRETYRGLMSDAVLDDPGLVAARERFWTAALTDERYGQNRAAVAERDGELVGIAMSGPPLDAAAAWTRQLYVLYVQAADHGTGAGRALLDAVIDPAESAALWVADPNPRAHAFYRKHGFVADGTAQVEDGVREIRMVRMVTIRRGTQTDAVAAADLWLRARKRSLSTIPAPVHDDDAVHRWFASHVVCDTELWIAENAAGTPVGILVLDGEWVDQLYVEPAMTGRGIGAELLSVAKRERPGGLRLWTFASNTPAQRFYERHGFVELDRTDGRDNEEHAPDILYTWRGTEAPADDT